ncbi:MAG: toxin-antitoxin system HicB family antitoxin [Acidobacteria bacterium]|nr:toxin-antitoxin system HicB family antitoxin [Acidobacteriota bacterium]
MNVNIEVPNDLYDKALEIARSQSISVADVFATACAEHVAAWERLERRAQRGDRARFLEVLAKVPDTDPGERDRLPND